MANNFTVSQSKVKTWRKCRKAYHLKYVEKLKQRKIKRPFKFGSIVHQMLEAHANADDPFEILDTISFKEAKLFAAEKELYGNIVQDIGIIMEEYFKFYPENHLVPLRKNKRSAEHPFEIEIEKGLSFKGVIDEVDKTPNGLKWLTDHKTFTRLPNEDHRWKNLQSAVYLRAVQMNGWWDNLAGTCWNYVRSKPPTRPQILKSGKLSEKNIDTLPSVVHSVLKENKLKPANYSKLIQSAEQNRNNYFFRIFTPISNRVVDKVFNGFVDTAREIVEHHGYKFDMNIDRHCDFCDYESICRAELTGSDVDFVKEREYYEDATKELDEDEEDLTIE